MNVWDFVLIVLGWIVLILLLLVITIFIAGVIKGLVSKLKAGKATKQEGPARVQLSDEAIIADAEMMSKAMYGNEIFFGPVKQEAYMAGVKHSLFARRARADADSL